MALKNILRPASFVYRDWRTLSNVKGSASTFVAKHAPGAVSNPRCLFSWTHAQRLDDEGSHTSQPVRFYARVSRKKQEIKSQLQDLPPTMLKFEYAAVPSAQIADDVVKRLLSLEFASHSEKLKLKEEQLIAMVQRNKDDRTSTEVKVAIMTARIRNYQEHLKKHPKDKVNKRRMLMSIDIRKKKLKFLRRTRYDAFEKVCQDLGITYTFPPEYYRRVTKRWLAKKALCIKVFKQAQRRDAISQASLLASTQPEEVGSSHAKGTPV